MPTLLKPPGLEPVLCQGKSRHHREGRPAGAARESPGRAMKTGVTAATTKAGDQMPKDLHFLPSSEPRKDGLGALPEKHGPCAVACALSHGGPGGGKGGLPVGWGPPESSPGPDALTPKRGNSRASTPHLPRVGAGALSSWPPATAHREPSPHRGGDSILPGPPGCRPLAKRTTRAGAQ